MCEVSPQFNLVIMFSACMIPACLVAAVARYVARRSVRAQEVLPFPVPVKDL